MPPKLTALIVSLPASLTESGGTCESHMQQIQARPRRSFKGWIDLRPSHVLAPASLRTHFASLIEGNGEI